MTTRKSSGQKPESWLDRTLNIGVRIDFETLIVCLIILAAILTRFYDLETRVMSHDESLHTYFSWSLSEGRGFEHTPLMHGPLQFHAVALSYFLFGDTDATSRIPAAVSSVLAVGMVLLFRRWLGRKGTLVAMGLMVISPYMMYYGRYVRNEPLLLPMVLLTVYSMIRYVESRRAIWIYLFALSLSLHFTTKETAFIYAAFFMIFLGVHLVWKLFSRAWKSVFHQIGFIVGAASGLSGLALIFYIIFGDRPVEMLSAAETIQPLDPTSGLPIAAGGPSQFGLLALILIVAGMLIAGASLILSFGRRLRVEFPTFDLLLVSGTMVLPQLAAVPGELLGWDVLAYEDPESFLRTRIAVVVLVFASAAIGMLWDWRRWLITACVFYVPFIILQTTVLTNPSGLATGLVGSLGYWLDQQEVHRGSQPLYYYLALQLPMYEYLPALGALLAPFAGFFGIIKKQDEGKTFSDAVATGSEAGGQSFPVHIFLFFWAIIAFGAFSFARERMPWLTVHITLPLILLSGYVFGQLIESIDWKDWRQRRFWLLALLLGLSMLSLVAMMAYGLGNPPPFQGSEIAQLQVTLGFLLALVMTLGSLVMLVLQASKWSLLDFFKLASLILLVALSTLTARAAFRASFINYDDPTEFLVYAHSATGVKTIMDQVEDLSLRTTDSLAIDVAYDDDVSWPFQWYLRDYTNPRFYSRNPTRDLLNYPLVIAGNDNWSRVDPILGDRYHVLEYNRMWWPMQDYFGLTWERIWNAIRSPEMRAALWDIWFDRDYEAYIAITGRSLTLENWYNADRMRLYIRKDAAALVWDYNMIPPDMSFLPGDDPYADGMQELHAVQVIGTQAGVAPGQFMHPKDVALAPDGSIFVADTGNHRIQHFSADGAVLNLWGEFGQIADGQSGSGQIFDAPWGIEVGPSGDVYVADTWNDRVLQYTPDGELLNVAGVGDLASPGDGMWGPRSIAIDNQGRVFVADTGNKRILIFDEQLNYLGEFGGGGAGAGRLDEPVGLAIDGEGLVYVADTWNMRVQVFEEISENWFIAVLEWPIHGWYGNSLDNKPYLAFSPSGHICASDPEGFLVLCFTTDGAYVAGWGGLGSSEARFGLPSGMAFDSEGAVWVVDSGNSRLMRFFPNLE
jgi:predicted membrane-bound mannosyltransferase/sugar lactone lactonase YvrE